MALRWDPEDTHWSQGRRKKGAGCGMWQMPLWKRQTVAGPLLEPSRVLPYRRLRCSRMTKPGLSPCCSWNRRTPNQGAALFHSMPGLPLLHLQAPRCPLLSLPDALLVSKAPAWAPRQRGGSRTGRSPGVKGLGPRASWKSPKEPLPWASGPWWCGHILQAFWGLLCRAQAKCSASPREQPTKGTGLGLQHMRFRADLRKPFLASHAGGGKRATACVLLGAPGSVRRTTSRCESHLSSNTGSTTLGWGVGLVASPLGASVSSSVKWG